MSEVRVHTTQKNEHAIPTSVTLVSMEGISCEVLMMGAAIRSLTVPTTDGARDVVLGWETQHEYETNPPFFGVCIGRVSGRIAGAEFIIGEKNIKTEENDMCGKNTLHGGSETWAKKMWTLSNHGVENGIPFAELKIISPDGESCFPGKVDARVRYSLEKDFGLKLKYYAKTTKPTPISLTNHSYFNLTGRGDILSHTLSLPNAEKVLLTESSGSGAIAEEVHVKHHPSLDFRKPTQLSKRILEIEKQYPFFPYGDAYIANKNPFKAIETVAVVEASGLQMTVSTDMPVLQLYFSNFLDNDKGKGGQVYPKYGGLCFETETYKDSLPRAQKQASGREAWIAKGSKHLILQPGQEFRQTTIFRFKSMESSSSSVNPIHSVL